MKKIASTCIFVLTMLSITFMSSSCATVFGGRVTSCQKTKPVPGQQQRDVRVGALIADVLLFWPGVIVDFATGAIYRPCDRHNGRVYAPGSVQL